MRKQWFLTLKQEFLKIFLMLVKIKKKKFETFFFSFYYVYYFIHIKSVNLQTFFGENLFYYRFKINRYSLSKNYNLIKLWTMLSIIKQQGYHKINVNAFSVLQSSQKKMFSVKYKSALCKQQILFYMFIRMVQCIDM